VIAGVTGWIERIGAATVRYAGTAWIAGAAWMDGAIADA